MLEHLPGKLMTRDNSALDAGAEYLRRAVPVPLPAAGARGGGAGLPFAAGPRERYPQLRWRARR